MKSTKLYIMIGVCIGILITGCSSVSKWERVSELSKNTVYPKPLKDVWPHVHEMLAHDSYIIASEEVGEFYLETEIRKDGTGGTSFSIQGKELTPTTSQVEFVKTSFNQSETNLGSEEDPIMEWKLLKYIDPQKANQIEKTAEAGK